MDELMKEFIRSKVQDAMAHSMLMYNFRDIIDDADLTEEQEKWAKENLDWTVVILEVE